MKQLLLKLDDETHEHLKQLQVTIKAKSRMSITLNNLIIDLINRKKLSAKGLTVNETNNQATA
jgi:hypothetical protein